MCLYRDPWSLKILLSRNGNEKKVAVYADDIKWFRSIKSLIDYVCLHCAVKHGPENSVYF